MRGERSLVIVVTQLLSEELDFFHRFGTQPAGPFAAAWLDQAGAECDPRESHLLLLLGNPARRSDRIVAAGLDTGADLRHAYLLVHPGGGIELCSAPGMEEPPREPAHGGIWAGLLDRSFAWSSGGMGGGPSVLGRFLKADLASSRGDGDRFAAALDLLREALGNALDQVPGNVEQAESRSDRTRRHLDDPVRRMAVGLDMRSPVAQARNPVAAILHDVVGRFDPLLMELDTALQEPGSFDGVKKHYASDNVRAGFATDLQALQAIVLGPETEQLRTSLSEVPLHTVDEIIRLVRPASGADAALDRTLEEIRSGLRALVTDDAGWTRLQQLKAANSWTEMDEPESTRAALAGWSFRLKSRFRALDVLFRDKFEKVET